jgi:tetratricopeptide (TPR) repeat protein
MHLRRSLRRLLFPLFLLLLLSGPAHAAPLDDAIALFRAKRYPEARAAFEKITAAEPKNAAAAYYLGMTIRRRADSTSIDEAVPWLAKAVELEPNNATYLADFGGSSMELAGKKASLSAATRGRDAMIRAIELGPENLKAREGLMQFYVQAPWPLGSTAKALAQAEEIYKRDATRGLIALITVKTADKKYAEAIALCEETLKIAPDNYGALFQLGKLASVSGEKLDRGLATLRHSLELTPPSNQPGHSVAHYRIGLILEKKGDKPGARSSYEAALKLDPTLKPAAEALAKL